MDEAEKQKERDRIAAEERAKVQQELKDKDDEITKLKDKDQNFGNVRKQLEDAEEAKKKLQQDISDRDQKDRDAVRDKEIGARVGTDEELKKKVLAEYDRLKKDGMSPEEVQKTADDAYTLATGNRYEPDATRRVMGGGQGGGNSPIRPRAAGAGEPSAELKDALAVFSEKGGLQIKDEDVAGLAARAAEKRRNAPSGD